MKNIEVEIRSFISEQKYLELIELFKKEGELINEDYQETYYFNSKEDLMIQRNNFFSKIWLKKGELHDNHREEIEVKCKKEDFEMLEKTFLALGYNIQIKWFRKRHTFKWQDISVMIDHTKGYGHIIELEKMSIEEQKHEVLEQLKQKLSSLNIALTPKEDFNKKYEFYKQNWKELTKN